MLRILCIIPLSIILTACSHFVLRSYDQNYESASDFATVDFTNFRGNSWIEELLICQSGNTGFVNLPKNKTIKVKANEAIHIQMKVRDRDKLCVVRLNVNFSDGQKYYLHSGIEYEKRSLTKSLLLGKGRGECKTYLDDEQISWNYSQLNTVPLAGRGNVCRAFSEGAVGQIKNIVNADRWIDLNTKVK